MPKIIDMVRDVAPAIGTLLAGAGPVGVAAGIALNAALGLPHDATEDMQVKAIQNATPEQILALKQADNDFSLKMRAADSADLATDAADRASARARDTASGSDVFNHVVMGFLSSFALVLLMFIIYLVATVPLQEAAKDIMLILVGTITGLVTQVYNYYFGSSTGSKQKTDSLSAVIASKGK